MKKQLRPAYDFAREQGHGRTAAREFAFYAEGRRTKRRLFERKLDLFDVYEEWCELV